MKSNKDLTVLISTFNDRIDQVKNVILDYRPDVDYIVSHQYSEGKYKYTPKELMRNDILISQIEGFGVTKSRNNAIKLAEGKIGVFADDDVAYKHTYFDTVINTFKKRPDVDIALFKIKTPDGFPEYKNYPLNSLKAEKLPFSVGTIEIAFNVKSLKDSGIFFDERFGAGQPLLIGSDENIFILDCLKQGMQVNYFSDYIVEHPFESTVKKIARYDKRIVSVTGAFDARVNGWVSIPKALFGSIKYFPDLVRHNKNPLFYFTERLRASLYILFSK